ncbi:phosphocarrier protein HPr [Spiroplasma sp. TIUS-1]|uniref:HPr family phosphocarrier protein n=1 Tax=Spiroplasma sp. TIUS-1 TaxID=216963 RepID=UPI001396FABD|nr:HPr family phosphocarrier protein [Spiroplasma sp. TIUS-1]QHX35647.1 phosphocarrier protein HPr [Spiroplasma sp. TIUS-1]
MTSIKAIIVDPVGLHARPASILTKEASKFTSEIKIKSGEKEGNLKSIMNIMALAIKTNTEVEIQATGTDEKEAIVAIEAAMKENNLI